jgi:hypothetical protein
MVGIASANNFSAALVTGKILLDFDKILVCHLTKLGLVIE